MMINILFVLIFRNSELIQSNRIWKRWYNFYNNSVMKSSLFVLCALFASASAVKLEPEDESVNLQVGVEAAARSNVREMLKANLRAALEHAPGHSRGDWDAWILPAADPYDPATALPSSNPDVFEGVQLSETQWPAAILPCSEPHEHLQSSNPDVFEETFVQVKDDDLPSVEDARMQAAQMQAQMDQAIAQADQKRAE